MEWLKDFVFGGEIEEGKGGGLKWMNKQKKKP